MRVCDCCKAENPDDVRIAVLKRPLAGVGKMIVAKREREVITIPMELCDSCLTRVMVNLGAFVKSREVFIEHWMPSAADGEDRVFNQEPGPSYDRNSQIGKAILHEQELREARERTEDAGPDNGQEND